MRPAVAAAAVLCLASASPASAGSFDVVSCGAAPGGENNAWTLTNTSPSQYTAAATCPPGSDPYGGLRIYDAIGSLNPPANTGAEWTFTAPPGTRIVRWRYRRWLGKDGDNEWDVYARLGDGTTLDECTIAFGAPNCSRGAPGQGSPGSLREAGGIDTAALRFGIRCAATDGSTCAIGGATIHRVWAALYESVVTLREDVPPSLAPPAGPLVDADGWQDGTREATLVAEDGVGIAATRLYVDGVVRDSVAHPCDHTFTRPCPAEVTSVLRLDTTALTDGEHAIRLAAEDAAGNEASAASRWIHVDNNPPDISLSAPSGPTRSEEIYVSWHGSDAGSGIAGYDVDVAVDGGAFETLMSGTLATGIRFRTSPGRTYRFRVRAVDGTGRRSPDAVSDELHVAPVEVAAPSPGGASDGWDRTVSPPAPGGSGDGAALADPLLRIRHASLRGRRLRVRLALARGASGPLSITAGRGAGRRPLRWSVEPRDGRGVLDLRLRTTAGLTGLLRVRYRGDGSHRGASAAARLSRR